MLARKLRVRPVAQTVAHRHSCAKKKTAQANAKEKHPNAIARRFIRVP